MRNIVECLDRYRTRLISTFLLAFSLLTGFLIIVQLLLILMRPTVGPFTGPSAPAWKRYFGFLMSIEPAIKICAVSGLFVFGILLAGWLLYKRKLAAEPEAGSAVRDERDRLFWLLAFRRAVAAVIALHLILWILQNIWPFFISGSPITAEPVFFMTLFVLVVVSLGTFLRFDRRATKLAEEIENFETPSAYHLKSFEAAVTRKASAVFGLYLGWHALFIAGRIYWNWRLLNMEGGPDDARILGYMQISRLILLVWIAVLAVLVYLLLVRSKKARRVGGETVGLGDERIFMNWLKACRFSFLLVLALLAVSALPSVAFNLLASELPHDLISSLVTWNFLLAGLHLGLLAATGGLLGSYLYFDRKN
jgi:hypothetical protein